MNPKRKDLTVPKTHGKQPTKRRRVAIASIDLTDIPSNSALWQPSSNKMGLVPNQFSSDPLRSSIRPASQKAAAMAIEPPQDLIENLSAIAGCDQVTAARYLKVKQNDMMAAANAILDGVNVASLESATTWDESIMDVDNEGNKNLHPLGHSAAPTRGPSPAPSLGLSNPTNKSDEDSQLAAALAMSRGDEYTQESGVVKPNGSEVKFGPATQKEYDANQWALIPSTAQEVVPDIPVAERKHEGFGPRILKHLPDADYTPNLISICHAIPIAREALLMRDSLKNDYGFDADWWRGASIPMPRIVHTSDGSAADPEVDKYDEFLTECQRLMAFLDRSKRSYASIGALTQTELIKNVPSNSKYGSLMELFLQSWTSASMRQHEDDPEKHGQLANLFTTTVDTNGRQGMENKELSVIDITVKPKDVEEKAELYEHLDNLLWDTDPDDKDRPDNYITRPADVVVMRASNSDPSASQLGLVIPAAFYMDKYLEENIGATKAIRDDMTREKARMRKISEIDKKLKNWQHPKKSTQLDTKQLLNHTLGHFSGENRRKIDEADTKNESSLADHPQPPHYAEISAQLEQVIASIDKKLEVLAAEKEKSRKAVAAMSKSHLPGGDEASCRYRYTLRGVATKPNITYILQPLTEGDRRSPPISDDDSTPDGYQWWRVEYGATLSIAKAEDYDVIRAVELEHNSALLVYASDEASSLDDLYDLPEELQAFVARDDEEFERELAQQPPGYSWADQDLGNVRQSIERSGSSDSMAALNGDGPPVYKDDLSPRTGIGYGMPHEDPAPVDIHLPPPAGAEIEMVETAHEPLIPRSVNGHGSGHDTKMGGAESQDDGMGGNV